MKYLGLLILVFLGGCEKRDDPDAVAWIKQSSEIDLRISGGMSYMVNGLSNDLAYEGKSESKAAQSILDRDPEITRLGPVIDITGYTILRGYCFRAKKGNVSGYVVFQGPFKDQKSKKFFWAGYRFYPEDFFLKMEQEHKQKKEPNQRLQTMRFKLPINAIAHGPHV